MKAFSTDITMRLTKLLLSILMLLCPAHVKAQAATAQLEDVTTQGEARRASYQAGRQAMLDRDWLRAHEIFSKLFREHRSYDVAMNLGQTEYNLKRYQEAAEHLRYAVEHMPPHQEVFVLERAHEGLKLAKQHIAEVSIVVNRPQVALSIGDRELGRSPLEQSVFLTPGQYTVTGKLGDATVQRSLTATAGAELKLELVVDPAKSTEPEASTQPASGKTLPPTAASPGDNSPDHSQPNYTPALIAGGVGVVGLATGVGFLFAASSKASGRDEQLNALSGNNPCASPTWETQTRTDCATVNDQNDSAETYRMLGFVGLGTAVVGAAAAVLLWPSSAYDEAGTALRIAPVDLAGRPGISTSITGVF